MFTLRALAPAFELHSGDYHVRLGQPLLRIHRQPPPGRPTGLMRLDDPTARNTGLSLTYVASTR
jgi:hypothetical protein